MRNQRRRSDMIKIGALTTAAVIALGMCTLSTDASAARVGGAHFGGGARMGGGVAHFGGPRVTGNFGVWRGNRGFGFRRFGGVGWSGGLAGYPAYASCYVWTPLGFVNQCGYDYTYYW